MCGRTACTVRRGGGRKARPVGPLWPHDPGASRRPYNEPTPQIRVIKAEHGCEPRSRSDQSRLCESELTPHVHLVLDNDEALYRQRCTIVRKHLAARQTCTFCGGTGATTHPGMRVPLRKCQECDGSSEVARYLHQLGDRLKDFCEELAGLDINENDLLSNLAREVLSTALAWVDWTGLAEAYIEEERETDHDG